MYSQQTTYQEIVSKTASILYHKCVPQTDATEFGNLRSEI